MKVLKFGGSSVASAENILKVIEIVKKQHHGEQLVLVASAMGGITNLLEECGEQSRKGDPNYQVTLNEISERHFRAISEIFPLKGQSSIIGEIKILLNELDDLCNGISLLHEMFPKTRDYLLGFGERLSAVIISAALNYHKIPTTLLDARELILTDESYGGAQVLFDRTEKQISRRIKEINDHVFVPGFIARSSDGHDTTLGRGGSDYTAAILAAAVAASELEIWTDVDGVMTADPNLVETALPLEKMSYEEVMELSHFGARVIFPPTLQPVMRKNIPLWIKNTFRPEGAGTLICREGKQNGHAIKGLSHVDKIVMLTLTGAGMVGVTGIAARFFSTLSREKVNVIFITQASSEHSITVAISKTDLKRAKHVVDKEFENEMVLTKIDPLLMEENLSVIALVGDKMKSSVGLSGKAFNALGKNGINIRAIAQGSTERNISLVVSDQDVTKALNVLHETFFLSKYKKVHLFMVGVGNVGSALLEQIHEQYEYLRNEYALEIKVVGLANSRKMLFDEKSVDMDHWKSDLLEKGEVMSRQAFLQKMKEMNLRNSVFVDNTASASIAGLYESVLQQSISVVASNKIAASSPYENYRSLNNLAKARNVKYLYETNVGAGLPVLKTLQGMMKSGDKVFRIQAVLSGSLNFIFNHFVEGVSFSDVVQQAIKEGYTEPDPRIDLSGQDVMRKILILGRECGIPLEFESVGNESFMPEPLMKMKTVSEFMEALPDYDAYFEEIRKKAENQNTKLRYVAELDSGKTRVGLRQVDASQPYYQLDGKDNIVLIYSKRYDEQPLVVKGAGAGASVTASGVFADIISVVNQ
jgi:aspartokinase/homoserine dehydrogenase 1